MAGGGNDIVAGGAVADVLSGSNGDDALLDRFLDEAAGLQDKFGVLLVQLPPKQAIDIPVV